MEKTIENAASSSRQMQISSLKRTFCGIDMSYMKSYAAVACEDDIIVGSGDGLLDLSGLKNVELECGMSPKTILGYKFLDEELKSELSSFHVNVSEDLDGLPLIHVPPFICSPVQLLADALSYIKVKTNVSDCCIGIPVHFTYKQRKELLAATTMARLIPRGILHETTAAALKYRFSEHFHKTKAGEVLNMAFIDVGYTGMQVSVIQLREDQLKVISHAHDKSIGGRAFDQVLFQFALRRLDIDTSQISNFSMSQINANPAGPLFDLFRSCVMLKHKLDRNNEAELMYDDKKVVLKRIEFERLSFSLLTKVKAVLEKALKESQLAVENVHSVKVIGRGTKMPAIMSVITDFFGKDSRFMVTEHKPIAAGCFLQCAMLCSTPKLPMFQIIDILPYSIGLSWQPENENELEQLVLFPKGVQFPSVKDVTLNRAGYFSVDLILINADDSHSLSKISTCMIHASQDNRLAEVNIKVRLDLYGMAYIEAVAVDGKDSSYSFIDIPYEEHQTAFRDKVQKAEKELADVSAQRMEVDEELQKERTKQQQVEDSKAALERQLSELKIESEKALKERDRQLSELIEREKAFKERGHSFEQVELHKKKVNYCTEFSASEINEATNNLDKSLIIGEGGFASVYKGFLRHTNVAIKILNSKSYLGDIEIAFNQEVEILTKVRHPNLISLIGASREARALVYEFLPNGSLDDYLTNEKDSCRKLSWQDRVRIASEICSALIFLHSIGKHGIAHGDLKPQNILLDSSFVSKIIDFGISRELKLTEKTKTPLHLTQYPKYTPAYADPEFFATSNLTPQSDTYSFGIILLQLVTSRSPRMIIDFVEDALDTGEMDDLVDVSTCRWPMENARKLALLGIRCCDSRRRNRPDLAKDVWPTIESLKHVAGQSIGEHSSRSSTQ